MPDAEPSAKVHVWADWTMFTPGTQGSAEAKLGLNSSVSYRGQLVDAQVAEGARNYWIPDQAYKSTVVPNAPASSDILMLFGGNDSLHELSFSPPVVDPVLSVMSMGSREKTTVCRFENEFDLLSHGPTPWQDWQPLKHLPDNVLSGRESSGTIRFRGTYDKIRFRTVVSEPWFGVTVGAPSAL